MPNQMASDEQYYSLSGDHQTAIITNLLPLTSYSFKVNCKNAIGWSDFSDPLNLTTLQEGKKKGQAKKGDYSYKVIN